MASPNQVLKMTYYLKLYVLTLLGFFAIDMIWLGLVARGFYKQQLGDLLADKPNWYAAVVFYLLFIAGMLVFAVVPGLQALSLRKALTLGACFGLITYATYDLTNLATLKNWPPLVTVVDMIWGMVLATAVSGIGFVAGRWLSNV
jgi:uncharacterized membrane protein